MFMSSVWNKGGGSVALSLFEMLLSIVSSVEEQNNVNQLLLQ